MANDKTKQGKRKGLAGMASVAGANEVASKTEDITDSNAEGKPEVDSLDGIISKVTNKPKVESKPQLAVYISDDVSKGFNRYARKHGKGAKSELVDELLRVALTKMGYLK